MQNWLFVTLPDFWNELKPPNHIWIYKCDKISGESLMHLLDLKGICVSTSSANTSGKDEHSHVLMALGLSEKQAKSAIRISYGRYNIMQEVESVIAAICNAHNKILGATANL